MPDSSDFSTQIATIRPFAREIPAVYEAVDIAEPGEPAAYLILYADAGRVVTDVVRAARSYNQVIMDVKQRHRFASFEFIPFKFAEREGVIMRMKH